MEPVLALATLKSLVKVPNDPAGKMIYGSIFKTLEEALTKAPNKQIMPVCPCYKVEYSVSEESVGEFGIGVCTCEGKPS